MPNSKKQSFQLLCCSPNRKFLYPQHIPRKENQRFDLIKKQMKKPIKNVNQNSYVSCK